MADTHNDEYSLVLPENVELRFEVAGVGSRVSAAILDYTILYSFIFAVFIAGYMNRGVVRRIVRDNPSIEWLSDAFSTGTGVLVILVFFGAWWGYFLLFELIWNGQTPGKRLFHLRVVRAEGQPISALSAIIRNILRAIDMFLAIGLAVMLVDKQSRRLGDFAAGTLVVREPHSGGRTLLNAVEIPAVGERAAALVPSMGRLTMAHYALIRDFFSRTRRMPPRQTSALAASLAPDIASTLGVDTTDIGDPVLFLAACARAFEEHHRYYESDGVQPAGTTGAGSQRG